MTAMVSTDHFHDFASSNGTDYHHSNLYGYTPTRWVGYVFVILFGMATISHAVQCIHSRLWWLLWTIVLASAAEVFGWGGRLWSSYGATNFTAYLMQSMLLILAPIPLVAASFIILGQIIRRLGQQYSRLNAKWYARIFVTCDVVALLVQGAGGGIVSQGSSSGKNTSLGTDIILGGIIFQTIAITFYMILAAEFIVRYLYKKPVRPSIGNTSAYQFDKNMKQMVVALAFSSLCVYVRSWYRMIEFADGYNGPIERTERYFVIMDGVMILLATLVMNIFHPGRLLGPRRTWKEEAIQLYEKAYLDGINEEGIPRGGNEVIYLDRASV